MWDCRKIGLLICTCTSHAYWKRRWFYQQLLLLYRHFLTCLRFDDMEVNRMYTTWFYWPFPNVQWIPRFCGNGCTCAKQLIPGHFSPPMWPRIKASALVGWARGRSPSMDNACALIAYHSTWVSIDISHYWYYCTTLGMGETPPAPTLAPAMWPMGPTKWQEWWFWLAAVPRSCNTTPFWATNKVRFRRVPTAHAQFTC